MSTHVDGAAPPVTPDPDDGNPEPQPSELDDGSQWVRAEIQRRMAANRSSRGRHARRGDAAAEQAGGPGGRGREIRRRDVTPPVPQRRIPAPAPVAPAPLTPADGVAAGDLPENYVPRHSVLTPGPAAEPAAPISGPIPVVRTDTAEGPNTIETRSAPVGGPSLPPTGMPLPVRKRRSGPGRPLQGGGPATGPWLRPGTSLVPDEPVQRLGAPPGMLGSAEPLPSWGVPASRRSAPVAPAPDTEVDDPRPDAVDDDAEQTVEGVVVGTGGVPAAVETADGTGDTAGAPVRRDYLDYEDYDDEDDYDDAGPPGVTAAATTDAGTATGVTDGGESATEADTAESDLLGSDPAEATTTTLPVVHAGSPPPARMVGIPVQRTSAHHRVVPPRPVTPRHIPVVGTAPPEPGSTRVRVVLSERKGVARPVRTIKEVQEGTAVGELLRRDLIRSQLMVTLRFAALTVLVLGALPAILAFLPEVGRFHVLGVRVPWLLLGLLMYPFLVGVAWRYTRVADGVEQNFADHVQD